MAWQSMAASMWRRQSIIKSLQYQNESEIISNAININGVIMANINAKIMASVNNQWRREMRQSMKIEICEEMAKRK